MEIIKSLLIASLFSIIAGQLLRLPINLNYGAINLTDVFVIFTDFVFLAYILIHKKTLVFSKKIIPPLAIFIFWVFTTNILSLRLFDFKQILISSLFLVRFLGYFFISQIVLNVIRKEKIINWLNLILLIGTFFIIIGFLQFIIFPDLTFLTSYGWDPHQKRIVSTILDPNFAGLIFTFIFSISTCLFLFTTPKRGIFKNIKLRYLSIASLAAASVIFTFSRSSYLALIFIILTIGILKSPKTLIVSLILLTVFLTSIPQARNRVIGAFSIDETSQARILSWKNALAILSQNPLVGVGFNNYRYAQAKYHLFLSPEQIEIHSASGSDSSLLLISATTGIVGLVLFLIFILAVISKLQKINNKKPIKLIALSSFLALIVHSQFVNSFFFPQIIVLFWFIFGLSQIDDL